MSNKWYSSSAEAYKQDKFKETVKDWYNKDGTLRFAAFVRGYVETYLADDGRWIRLEYRSSGLYEVAFLESENSSYEYTLFDRLKDARRKVAELKRGRK